MKERPILFSAPMVRAIQAGTKTQTRRIVKPQPDFDPWHHAHIDKLGLCKFGKPGDQLWVREPWRCFGGREYEYQQEKSSIIYRCDVNPSDDVAEWRPSIFMFRWASRISLLIKSIRVERLQDISESDAKAEGLTCLTKDGNLFKYGIPESDGLPGAQGWQWQDWCANPIDAYKKLWNDINGADAWEKNPFVWVVEFEVMK